MSRNLNDLYNLYQYVLRKERGVFTTIPQFTQNLDAGQLDAVEDWYSEYGKNQIIHDALRTIRVYQPFTSNFSGFVTYASDYIHLLGQPFTVTGSRVNPIEFINEDELPFALTSQLRPITTTNPIAVDSSTGFSIYPQSQQTGAYFYLRRPLTPVYSYTQSGRTITYDNATSVQLEFNEMYWNNILARALTYASVYMDEEGILKFAEMYKQETSND